MTKTKQTLPYVPAREAVPGASYLPGPLCRGCRAEAAAL